MLCKHTSKHCMLQQINKEIFKKFPYLFVGLKSLYIYLYINILTNFYRGHGEGTGNGFVIEDGKFFVLFLQSKDIKQRKKMLR